MMKEEVFSISATKEHKTSYGLSFRLTKDITKFRGYDGHIAKMHLNNCGYAIIFATYEFPNIYCISDNEYDLDEIYTMMDNGEVDTEICENVMASCCWAD